MFQDVLKYQWERNRLLNAAAELWPDYVDTLLEDPTLMRVEDLSQRLTGIVIQDQFDVMRANMMLAREVAYWREWLDTLAESIDKNDEHEQVKLQEMAASIRSFAAFHF